MSLNVLSSAVKKLIDSKYFFCKRSVRFIPIDQACDGIEDCIGAEDEITCVSSFKVNTTYPGKGKDLTLSCFVSAHTQRQTAGKQTMSPFLSTSSAVRLKSARHVLQVHSPGAGWSSVCVEGWTQQHTETACKQLGYTK